MSIEKSNVELVKELKEELLNIESAIYIEKAKAIILTRL